MATVKRDYITIVTGLPRSGTSMMMRMLDAGGMDVIVDEMREADEDNPRGYYEFEPVKKMKDDASWLASAQGKAVKMVYRLLYDLPDDYAYRLLFMRRRLPEILKSQDKMLERRGEPTGTIAEARFVQLFSSELERVDDWIERQGNVTCLNVDYNAMVQDPSSQLATIMAFLDGGLNMEAMAAIVEPKLYRQRQ